MAIYHPFGGSGWRESGGFSSSGYVVSMVDRTFIVLKSSKSRNRNQKTSRIIVIKQVRAINTAGWKIV
jgi:hypothetical protein